MKSTIIKAAVSLGLAGATLAAAVPASAHHAFAAEFDAAKPITVQGTVSKVRFVNPHSWIYVDVKAKDGTVTNWGFEFGTPSALRDNGLTRDDVQPGASVQIGGFRSKNGGPFGYATSVTFANGHRIQTGSAPDAPPAKI